MSSLSISTGLISGLDYESLIKAYSINQQLVIDRMTARAEEFSIKKTGLEALEANLLTVNASITTLGNAVTFEQFSVSNSDESQLKISAAKTADPGSYSFQALQKSAAHQSLSRGFADATTQTIGEGTLTISQGGFLDDSTLLESLNDGAGIRRGNIRITDRSGSSAVIDLTRAISVDDVLEEINNNVDIAIDARVVDGKFVLEDTSGSTSSNLTVVDLNGGSTAVDLGLDKSVGSSTLEGDDVFETTENFQLAQLNDGNGLRLLTGAEDLRVTAADGTELDVNLDGSKTLKDILDKINNHEDNGGKVEATVANNRIVLTDTTGGAGTLSVENLNDAAVARQLGLETTASGATLTGNRVSAGMNDVLLRNLRGGQGVTELGNITITDRSGQTGTIDLSGMETLGEVMEAINSATDDISGDPLQIQVSLNANKNGLLVSDTSGASASNLIIADEAGSSLAAEFNLEVDDAVSSINSGSLALRYVNESTSLSTYAPDGAAVAEGMFQITDSAGNVGVINITSAAKNIGDVIQRINASDSISVRAELNETGDGFVIIDEAGGTETLKVDEFGDSTTAADLRLLGDSYTGDDTVQRLSSRRVAQVTIESDDTLDDLVRKLNETGTMISASTFDDGSTFNSTRLSVSARTSGADGRLMIDDGGLGMNFSTIVHAQDSILQVGADPATAFLITSETNSFDEVVKGIDVDIRAVGSRSATIDITPNTQSVVDNLSRFVETYNQFVDITNELTKFNSETNERGILQGDSIVLRAVSRMSSAVLVRTGNSNEKIRTLSELGVQFNDKGKIEFDETKLQAYLASDLAAVEEFFTKEDVGFAAKMEATLKSMTDIVDGSITQEKNVLNASIEQTEVRVEELTELMESKKARLLNQFVAMENVLNSLNTQQEALGTLQPVKSNSSSSK